jgi:hypothetical protein
MLQTAYLIRFGLIFIVVGGVGTSQAAVRWATRAELIDIEKAVQRLVSAANNRDAKAVQAGTTAIFDAAGEGWAFNREGMAPWSARKAESLAAAELRVLLRHAQMLSDEVAVADGYFRTTRLPAGDLSGNVTATMVKREGVWLVSTVRFAPIQSSLAMTPVKIAKDHPAPSPDGWVILFTGKSVDGFLSPGRSGRSDSWKIKDGLLTNSPSNGMPRQGLLTKDTYTSFELEFDWRIASKGNSGIKYRLFYLTDSDAAGYEYQLADDAGDPGALRSSRERSGALYGVLPPMKSVVKPAGEFNHSVLVLRGRHCEHWLNGEKVVDYETNSEPLESPILLQHHGSDVWFRNIRIRRLQ